ncbi:hypothetical protein ACPCUV_29700 [Streptomyces platensis]|uniref:hypothetical protein n=1 Tax=Streptomyces platensis TaxID=58346 RepID=UPI003C2AFA48
MSTTNGHPDDPQSHGTQPAQPPTPDQTPAERPRAQDALGWTTLGLSAAFCTTGVVLTLTGHEGAGVALIGAGALGGGIQINIPARK